jgi:gamma-glutamylcyclotransferase (GGCT)/AIG2-like uncharacterized protein YtfP
MGNYEKNVSTRVFPVFVYGTLRKKGKFEYYLVDAAEYVGEYYIDGTLMCMTSGDVYVQKDGSNNCTIGELYHVSHASLQRIFHLENASGSFPKAYELSISLVHSMSNPTISMPALWFSLKKEAPANKSDYFLIKSLLDELKKELVEGDKDLSKDAVNDALRDKMRCASPT